MYIVIALKIMAKLWVRLHDLFKYFEDGDKSAVLSESHCKIICFLPKAQIANL